MSYAALDIGSNSCRLLIADKDKEKLHVLYREIETTRMAAGLSTTGRITAAAAEQSWRWLEKARQILQTYGVQYYRAVATSAVREAVNGPEFAREAMRRSHLRLEIISGEEEARLSYIGVEKGLALKSPPLVVDLGGGSSEFICNHQNFAVSLPVGAVRAAEMSMSAADIAERLQPLQSMQTRFKNYPLVMVGGTASTLASIKLGLITYDSVQVHGYRVSRREIADIYRMLESTPLAMRRKLPGLQPERADIINTGVLIIIQIMDILQKDKMIVSDSDLLQGIIWSPEILFTK